MKERKFINECIRAYFHKENTEKLYNLYRSVDPEVLNGLIIEQNIGGFFYHLYINKVFQKLNIPSKIAEDWKKTAGKNSLVNSINDAEAMWFGDLLDKNKIDHIFFKGISTRRHCYDNDYIKYSTDIDLLIKQKDYERVKAILLKNSYCIPVDHYTEDIAIMIPFEEFEKNESEISFIKKEGSLTTVIDLQWDLLDSDKKSVFHDLYNINDFFHFNNTEEAILENKKIKVLDIESQFINMAFHFAFHHGFRGIQWLIDICSLLKKHGEKINFKKILKNSSDDLKKITGIVLMLAYELDSYQDHEKDWQKSFYVDRLLPLEYRYYRQMALKPVSGISNSISLLITKILLPYRFCSRVRVFNYMFFNPDSIAHRLNPVKKPKSFLLPFYLLRLLIFDVIRKRKNTH